VLGNRQLECRPGEFRILGIPDAETALEAAEPDVVGQPQTAPGHAGSDEAAADEQGL
jgi:hypothetical protein